MSGYPAFQQNAFQSNAFQAGTLVVAATFTVGRPEFGVPTFLTGVSASPLTIGSPTFGTPNAYQVQLLGVAAYTVGRPVFAAPFVRQFQQVTIAVSYTTGSPVFAAPAMGQQQQLFVNAYASGSLAFDAPAVTNNYVFGAPPLDIAGGGLEFGAPDLQNVGHYLISGWFGIASPLFGRPWLTQVEQPQPAPFYLETIDEAIAVLNDMLKDLLASVPSQFGLNGSDLRRQVGDLMAYAEPLIRSATLGAPLLGCFEAARLAGATIDGMDLIRQHLLNQTPKGKAAIAVVQAGILFSLVEDSKIIVGMTFTSRDDIDVMVDRMHEAFQPAIETAADDLDSATYQSILQLAGSLTNYLATAELPLPQMVTYKMGMPTPSLTLSNRIYGDGSRYDELAQENNVIHPAFCPRQGRALSF